MAHIRLELMVMGRLHGIVCSGMILTRVQILTAAHCFDATPHIGVDRILHIWEILRSEVCNLFNVWQLVLFFVRFILEPFFMMNGKGKHLIK